MKRGKDRAGVVLALALSVVLHAGVAFVDIGDYSAKKKGASEILTVSLVTMPLPEAAPSPATPAVEAVPPPAPPSPEKVALLATALEMAAKAPPKAKPAKNGGKTEETIKLEPLKSIPDPQKDVGEVTISMGEVDTRYRGFLDRVRSAVDLSWNWREALVASGKPGKVTVRMTLTPGGQAAATVINSSGSMPLDRETVATVGRADMPPFPEEWTITRLNLIAEFEYSYGN